MNKEMSIQTYCAQKERTDEEKNEKKITYFFGTVYGGEPE